ncbi:hypothetical protein N0V88_006061 [Collariella sp. IMI 366227]|nr:hypothetical protein N0V88_006061 [Collariella sp. IMI 366227]
MAQRTMPSYDRPVLAGHRQQPSAARAPVNKPPLTPKIATARSQQPQPPQSQQPPTLATPLARRPTAESTLSVNGPPSRDRDALTSPISAFINNNITPRSGSRQSRVNSTTTTPNGTPNLDRHAPDQWDIRSGLSIADDGLRRPMVTFSSPSEVGSVARSDRDAKFFYASDAQKQPPQPAITRPLPLMPQQKPATFLYANGEAVPGRQAPVPRPFSPPPLMSPSPQDSLMSKFVYANGAPELQPAPKIGSASGSVVSTTSRLPPSVRPARATSPVKPSPSAVTKNSTAPSAISPRSAVSRTVPQTANQAIQARMNAELHSARPTRSHTRTKSAAVVEQPAPTLKPKPAHNSVPSSGATSPTNPTQLSLTLPPNPSVAAGFASLIQAAEDFAESEEAKAEEVKTESLDSSTKPPPPEGKQPISMVANARRERKVQDLQITNASLEAINRTLERQLRKQTAEIRRFQRLSRAGRLSMGSLASLKARTNSDSSVEGGGLARAGMSLDDLDEEEEDSDLEPEEESDLDSESDSDLDDVDDDNLSIASNELSPGASALRHHKQRRDERRLALDLSKHQQLLIDSQKINMSLKRCLGWTEELIKEGKRALAYQVKPGDVALGGRVLAPEELERRQREEDARSTSTWSEKPQDRDSGIELGAKEEAVKA